MLLNIGASAPESITYACLSSELKVAESARIVCCSFGVHSVKSAFSVSDGLNEPGVQNSV